MRLVLCSLFLLAGAAPGGTPLLASAAPAPAVGGGDLLGFQLVTPGYGWALMGQHLYSTDSGGNQWSEITPPNLGPAGIRAVAFADAAQGWLVTTEPDATGDLSYTLARTGDGGRTWQSKPLELFSAGDAAGMAGDVYLQFIDAGTGWLVVKQATSSNFNLGALFKTSDGGDNWTRLSLPIGAPVRFTSALDGRIDASRSGNGRYVTHDGGQTWTAQAEVNAPSATEPGGESLSAVSMATAQAGWARSAAGECDAGTCGLITKLLSTTDGGQTWTPVSLPGGQQAVERTFAGPATAAPGQSAGGLRLTLDGQGWDACTLASLPKLSDMQTWYANSPYRAWNLYIGGSSRANCGTLIRAYLQQLAQQGWLFIPTWVGPQAPCTSFGNRMSADPATAYSQGVIEAFLARNVAKNLGLTLPDLSGTVIYYDVEYYTDNSSDLACRQAVKAFISGWSGELRVTGDKAGVYGAPCGPSLSDFAQITNVPDMIWIAWWRYAGYDPIASVWHAPCLSDTLWTSSQRLRQYAGGHDESWGGVTYNIDSDAILGSVSTIADACTPAGGQVALFVYPNFGGQCVVKGLGGYPTAAAIGLPAQSISSLRVSSGVTVTLCQGELYAPACAVFTADQADLGGAAVGDDQASSAVVFTGSLALTDTVYLPIIGASAGAPVPLPNGDFESGPAQWSTRSAQNRTLIAPSSVLTSAGVAPHGGNWAVWLGGVPTETASIQQAVLIPPSAPYLGYWHWVDSAEGACYYDFASVWVNNTILDSYGLCVGSNTHGWAKHVVSLSAQAGQVVSIKIQVNTDAFVNSNLFVDDVAFQATP